ncbi:uncharacterized protein ACDP82_020067 isoform 1-T1 [Pangshura tecta]
MILLWLLCAGVTGQEFCSSPGDLPAPKLFLNMTSAQEGDLVLVRCAHLPNSLVTKVIFCKDGVAFSSQKLKLEQISSTLLLITSMKSAGRYSCGYQHKDEKNQVSSSNHSAPVQLTVTDRKAPPDGSSVTDRPENTLPHKDRNVHSSDTDHTNSDSSEKKSIPYGWRLGEEATWGIAGLSVLCLAPLIYLLVKKVASKRRCPREQLPTRSTENTLTDEQIHYAAISEFGAAMIPRVQENETVTYATVGKVRDRPS